MEYRIIIYTDNDNEVECFLKEKDFYELRKTYRAVANNGFFMNDDYKELDTYFECEEVVIDVANIDFIKILEIYEGAE